VPSREGLTISQSGKGREELRGAEPLDRNCQERPSIAAPRLDPACSGVPRSPPSSARATTGTHGRPRRLTSGSGLPALGASHRLPIACFLALVMSLSFVEHRNKKGAYIEISVTSE